MIINFHDDEIARLTVKTNPKKWLQLNFWLYVINKVKNRERFEFVVVNFSFQNGEIKASFNDLEFEAEARKLFIKMSQSVTSEHLAT